MEPGDIERRIEDHEERIVEVREDVDGLEATWGPIGEFLSAVKVIGASLLKVVKPIVVGASAALALGLAWRQWFHR